MENDVNLKELLDQRYDLYNSPLFIALDPISIPHLFTNKQDIEIAGLLSATLAWGQRVTIINKCKDLLGRMDNDPYRFIMNHSAKDLQGLSGFVHRTFNDTDLFYFIHFLKSHYSQSVSLETAFSDGITDTDTDIGSALNHFNNYFFNSEYAPIRTRKHVSSVSKGSSCKRLCMYLRWMVRMDNRGVDFGIWKRIRPYQLVCPIDVHVERVARKLGLIKGTPVNWQTALELTRALKKFDPLDPVKYDFSLFGMGVLEKY